MLAWYAEVTGYLKRWWNFHSWRLSRFGCTKPMLTSPGPSSSFAAGASCTWDFLRPLCARVCMWTFRRSQKSDQFACIAMLLCCAPAVLESFAFCLFKTVPEEDEQLSCFNTQTFLWRKCIWQLWISCLDQLVLLFWVGSLYCVSCMLIFSLGKAGRGDLDVNTLKWPLATQY